MEHRNLKDKPANPVPPKKDQINKQKPVECQVGVMKALGYMCKDRRSRKRLVHLWCLLMCIFAASSRPLFVVWVGGLCGRGGKTFSSIPSSTMNIANENATSSWPRARKNGLQEKSEKLPTNCSPPNKIKPRLISRYLMLFTLKIQ